MAGILRGCSIPRVSISGYGANNYYPERIFTTAAIAIAAKIGLSPFEAIYGSVHLIDIEKLLTQTSPSGR
jgi:hypothetical protein